MAKKLIVFVVLFLGACNLNASGLTNRKSTKTKHPKTTRPIPTEIFDEHDKTIRTPLDDSFNAFGLQTAKSTKIKRTKTTSKRPKTTGPISVETFDEQDKTIRIPLDDRFDDFQPSPTMKTSFNAPEDDPSASDSAVSGQDNALMIIPQSFDVQELNNGLGDIYHEFYASASRKPTIEDLMQMPPEEAAHFIHRLSKGVRVALQTGTGDSQKDKKASDVVLILDKVQKFLKGYYASPLAITDGRNEAASKIKKWWIKHKKESLVIKALSLALRLTQQPVLPFSKQPVPVRSTQNHRHSIERALELALRLQYP